MPCEEQRTARCGVAVLLLLLCMHTALLARIAVRHSPTYNELSHLSAGLRIWCEGKFDLYVVNPPLVKAVAAVPVAGLEPKTDWNAIGVEPRPEIQTGERFAKINSRGVVWYLRVARWMCIPFSILGAYVCYCWGRELYGNVAGLTASILWCFSPYVLGHGSLITADVPAACFGVLAGFLFWRWLRQPSWPTTVAAGLGLGLAELAKFSWIVLFLLWPLLWFTWFGVWRCKWNWRTISCHGAMLSLMLALAVLVINAGYGCEASFQRLGEYHFVSRALGAYYTDNGFPQHQHHSGNRFANSWVGTIPIPLPRNYLLGIDMQNHDFEAGMFSYLRGEWSDHGWWYYYLYALLIKVPLGVWALMAMAIGATIFVKGYSASWRDEMVVLVPGLVILIFVSSQTGFSVHSRYVIPALPFLFVWTSKVGRVFEMRPFTKKRLAMATVVVLALAWSASSSLAVYPHSLSYFNELAAVLPTPADASYPEPIGTGEEDRGIVSRIGKTLTAGSRNGPRHLLDSNIDWGQDLFCLEDWCESHPEAEPIKVAYFGGYPLDQSKIKSAGRPPIGPNWEQIDDKTDTATFGPLPGWYALSVNEIYGRSQQYRYFLYFEPVATAGYSIYIYHITIDEANRVRRELGLEELRVDGGKGKAEGRDG